MEFLGKFWGKYLGRFGLFNILLLALENILDENFFCPCKHVYNLAICFLYGFVPALGCFIWTWYFLDLSPNENEVDVEISRPDSQRLYSALSVLVWVSLFFLDSRYVACAGSYWDGVYTKSTTLEIVKWCKPIGNETSVLESEQWTLHMMIISQFTGFSLMTLVIIALPHCQKYCQKRQMEQNRATPRGRRNSNDDDLIMPR